MNISEYYTKLNLQSQKIFQETLENSHNLGKCHHFSSFISEFSDCIADNDIKKILQTVFIQLESATLNLALGLYRQAFSSLRLAFELGLGAIHFSINRLELEEWKAGVCDIKWSKLIDNDNGVLSNRFCKAFFPSLQAHILTINGDAKLTYRAMSEFVHGNSETWDTNGFTISYNFTLIEKYFQIFQSVCEILIFSLCCRYLQTIEAKQIEKLSPFLLEELTHFSPIREFLGGAKEIQHDGI